MQNKRSLLFSLCLGFYFSTFAALPASASPSRSDDFVPPKVLSVVPPTHAPAGYENVTVKLTLLVDARGLPRHVDTLDLVSTEARELVIGAVERWRFIPATRHGIPVSVRVILPLKLATSDR